MDKVKKHLDSAYYWLSKIPVTGESVDWMAMARQELREAFRALPDDESEKEVKQDG